MSCLYIEGKLGERGASNCALPGTGCLIPGEGGEGGGGGMGGGSNILGGGFLPGICFPCFWFPFFWEAFVSGDVILSSPPGLFFYPRFILCYVQQCAYAPGVFICTYDHDTFVLLCEPCKAVIRNAYEPKW